MITPLVGGRGEVAPSQLPPGFTVLCSAVATRVTSTSTWSLSSVLAMSIGSHYERNKAICSRITWAYDSARLLKGVPPPPTPQVPHLLLEYSPRRRLLDLEEAEGLSFHKRTWGWPVSWGGGLLVNARDDSLYSKSVYQGAEPVLIPATSFWEKGVQFSLPNQEPFYLAALRRDQGVVVITTAAERAVALVHHRMPMYFSQEQGLAFLHHTAQGGKIGRSSYAPLHTLERTLG